MKIAIIGTGIAGNVAAYHLAKEHEITVFEAAGYVGGHTNTADIEYRGRSYAVDTGFIVFNDGSRAWLDTVTTHELTHVFQFHILVEGFWKSARILKTIVYPLWMMEGMAEYYSWGLDDTPGSILVRDAATSEGLIRLEELAMSGVSSPAPAQKSFNPPPEPVLSTPLV